MTRVISDKEMRAVIQLSNEQRYEYFIKEIVDRELVWSLGDENGWVLSMDDQGNECVPLWPHERYAEVCAFGKWVGNYPKEITLEELETKWIPGMEKDRRRVSVFRTPDDRSAVRRPQDILRDIGIELLKYD